MENEFSFPENPERINFTLLSEKKSALSMTKPTVVDPGLISVCSCLLSSGNESLQVPAISKRKRKIFSNDVRTETYLRERRIPELIRYILAKLLCNNPKSKSMYVAQLLDECMIFRSGIGQAPVLFEERHLEAIIKSFDPGNRGWLSAGQVRKAYTIIGLTPKTNLQVRTPTAEVLDLLRHSQESELLSLLTAGSEIDDEFLE